MWDVIIGGAGPAGLTAAIRLAQSGRRVLLLDPHAHGRHKIGECVPGAMARLVAKLGLPSLDESGSRHRRIGGIVSLWAGELRKEDHLSKPEGGGWRLDRGAFESSLAESAAIHGAILTPGRISQITHRGDIWQVETEDRDIFYTRRLIDATGRNAAVARRFGAKQIHGPPLVAVWSLGRPAREAASNRTFIESTPDGWWYAAYLPDRRPVAIFHTTPALAAELKAQPHQWLERLRHTGNIAPHFAPDAFYRTALKANDARSSHLDHPYGQGWSACGDAVMAFDPLSSQGIYSAMVSADTLATAITDGTPMEDYARSLKEVESAYHKRRHHLYESASRHYSTAFWKTCLHPAESAASPLPLG